MQNDSSSYKTPLKSIENIILYLMKYYYVQPLSAVSINISSDVS